MNNHARFHQISNHDLKPPLFKNPTETKTQ